MVEGEGVNSYAPPSSPGNFKLIRKYDPVICLQRVQTEVAMSIWRRDPDACGIFADLPKIHLEEPAPQWHR